MIRLWPFKKRERWWLVAVTEKQPHLYSERLLGIFTSEGDARSFRHTIESDPAHQSFVLRLNELVGAGFWIDIRQVR